MAIYVVAMHKLNKLIQTLIGNYIYCLLANRKIMRLIAVIIMKMMLTKAKNDRFACDNTIVKQAYDIMIKNYEDTIMFLKANRK